ncbi:L-serine ammonia-lyase [Herbiconiux sp. YIM B11900]|uniref:L-serine ammonia-lyase n=1 Tax=Herbiconiux sp. YIM B11900 TaxID=3404131 RepID=UPI003F8356AB
MTSSSHPAALTSAVDDGVGSGTHRAAGGERIAGVFELFSIGIGPSSSHTVGPMRAAREFALECAAAHPDAAPDALSVDVFGSLAATGKGHNTFGAVLLGLERGEPETIDPEAGRMRVAEIEAGAPLRLAGSAAAGIRFGTVDIAKHPLVVRGRFANEIAFSARFGDTVHAATFFSIGGGFILREGADQSPAAVPSAVEPPATAQPAAVSPAGGRTALHPFASGAELLAVCRESGLSVAEVVLANEAARHPEGADGVREGLHRIWSVMRECIEAGLSAEGELPGGLRVPRRAARLAQALAADGAGNSPEWATIAAMAVNEENAAGNRVVTAPTNGAAGIVPAVLYHALGRRHPGAFESAEALRDVEIYLLTAAAIGGIIKQRASISGADVGCQGEVGSASAMAAAGLAALLDANPAQVENAAEVAMEHHLGLTCDPIGGLVQIPCIERNGVAAVTAITAAKLAVSGDGAHHVSFDQVVETMRQTGADMSDKYRETSRGGLAVNVPEC